MALSIPHLLPSPIAASFLEAVRERPALGTLAFPDLPLSADARARNVTPANALAFQSFALSLLFSGRRLLAESEWAGKDGAAIDAEWRVEDHGAWMPLPLGSLEFKASSGRRIRVGAVSTEGDVTMASGWASQDASALLFLNVSAGGKLTTRYEMTYEGDAVLGLLKFLGFPESETSYARLCGLSERLQKAISGSAPYRYRDVSCSRRFERETAGGDLHLIMRQVYSRLDGTGVSLRFPNDPRRVRAFHARVVLESPRDADGPMPLAPDFQSPFFQYAEHRVLEAQLGDAVRWVSA